MDMTKVKPLILTVAAFLTIALLIPALLVVPFMDKQNTAEETAAPSEEVTLDIEPSNELDLDIAVYRSQQDEIEEVQLEAYIAGVVASEMPAEFEMEALKAQALTARTYIVRKLMSGESLNTPDGSDVTDTVMHQVYKSPTELKEIWGSEYEWKMKRIKQAVEATRGKIITFKGDPITASFFSTSNGFTENSEDYWQNAFPYLKSVESPWDKTSPKYADQKVVTVSQVEKALGVRIGTSQTIGKIIERTAGNRIGKIKIGNKTFAGREVRESLNLRSSDFTLERKGHQVIIRTKGYGHGVGMSQYGANGMAKEGSKVTDIIAHYYQGTEITPVEGEKALALKE
jgi:stage II sporulation protein D